MDRHQRLTEAKLMAIEDIVEAFGRKCLIADSPLNGYEVAKDILDAIKDVEIEDELREHEASLEEGSRNQPE
jgi:hypothetical protein